MITVHLQGKLFDITVIQVYVPTSDAKETEVDSFYEDLEDLLEIAPKKMPFSSQRIGMKSRKSRDTWSNRQVCSWSTK